LYPIIFLADALIAAVDMWWAEKDVCQIAVNNLKATDAVWDGCGHTVPVNTKKFLSLKNKLN